MPDAGAGPGHGRLGPKWPDNGWLWLVNNALLVTLAEEALFRGYIQERLGRLWRARRWGADAALLCAAALFGLAHYAGGWQWMLLAGLAGPPTAWPTATAAWRRRCWRTWR